MQIKFHETFVKGCGWLTSIHIPQLVLTTTYIPWIYSDLVSLGAYLIFVIFSPPIQFLAQFFHAKARKSRQNGFRKNSVIRNKTDFTTTKQGIFFISSHMSCGDMWNSSKFGKISHFYASIVWKKLKFLCMWRNFKFLHICHALKSEISPHDWFFSTYI